MSQKKLLYKIYHSLVDPILKVIGFYVALRKDRILGDKDGSYYFKQNNKSSAQVYGPAISSKNDSDKLIATCKGMKNECFVPEYRVDIYSKEESYIQRKRQIARLSLN